MSVEHAHVEKVVALWTVEVECILPRNSSFFPSYRPTRHVDILGVLSLQRLEAVESPDWLVEALRAYQPSFSIDLEIIEESVVPTHSAMI